MRWGVRKAEKSSGGSKKASSKKSDKSSNKKAANSSKNPYAEYNKALADYYENKAKYDKRAKAKKIAKKVTNGIAIAAPIIFLAMGQYAAAAKSAPGAINSGKSFVDSMISSHTTIERIPNDQIPDFLKNVDLNELAKYKKM